MIKTAYLSIRRSYFKENFIDPWTSLWFNVLFFKVLWVAFIIRLYLFNVHFPNIGGTVFISLYSLEMFESIVLKRVQFKIHSFIEKNRRFNKKLTDRLDRLVVLKKKDFKLCCKLNTTIAAYIASTQIKKRERVIINPDACRILRVVNCDVTKIFKSNLNLYLLQRSEKQLRYVS